MSNQFELTELAFKTRFREMEKIDDLFNRGYILCEDTLTHKRAIMKHYSIDNASSTEAVLQNMENFAKLEKIQGICELLAYAKSNADSELAAVFDFDEKTLCETVAQFMANGHSEMPLTNRIDFYLQILTGVTEIVQITSEVGIQLDDLNKQTIVISNLQTLISSASSIPSGRLRLKILYDERDREYENLLDNITCLRNGNKCYWSRKKIKSQVLRGQAFWESQELIYQLGLILLDVIYDCEKSSGSSSRISQPSDAMLLQPDHSIENVVEKKKGYYRVDRMQNTVERDEIFVAFKLNYLCTLEDVVVKRIVKLVKEMIGESSEDRPDLEELVRQIEEIWGLFKKEISSVGAIFSNEDLSMGANHQLGRSEEAIVDSLKYSENSLSYNEDFRSLGQEVYVRKNQNYSPAPKKEIYMPLSATTIATSEANSGNHKPVTHIAKKQVDLINIEETYEPNDHYENQVRGSEFQSQRASELIQQSIIMNSCQGHHEGLRNSLHGAIIEVNQKHRRNSDMVGKKQYHDGSCYYGCIEPRSQKRQGLGIYLYKAGDVYFGTWKENALIHGNYLFKNGESFEGNVKGGKQGHGIYRYANGNVYEGHWKDDLKNGRGLMVYPSGAKYDGDWVKGKKHGTGSYDYENGLKYHGGFALGKKYGNGEFLFPNGTRVEGFWDNNHLQGKTQIYYHNGDYYEGSVHMSQKNGEGVYKWNSEDGEIEYKGEFKKDSLEGFAVIRFKTGEMYEGKIKHGKRDGQGTYLYQNGDEYRGEWKNDQKIMGKYIFRSGDLFEGKFKEGQISFGTFHYSNGEVYQGEFLNGERHGVGTYANKLGQIVFEGHWLKDEFIKSREL